jgi:hypothetical protein
MLIDWQGTLINPLYEHVLINKSQNCMQKYNNSSENLRNISEISGYMLLKLNLYQVEIMSKFGLSVDDVRHIPMYEEYLSLRRDGVPKERIYQYFRTKYHVSESTTKRVIKRLSAQVSL